MMGQNTVNTRRFLAVLLTAVLTLAYLPAVSAAEAALTEYVINLNEGSAEIAASTQKPGWVIVKRGNHSSDDINPKVTSFVFTTNGETSSNSFGITNGVTQDLNLVFRNCIVHANGSSYSSAYNDSGSGWVILTLEGKNELWSGSDRAGLRIPPGRTYEVHGPGALGTTGGAPFGVFGNNGYEPAGTLRLRSGTLRTDDTHKSNASIVYYGGSMQVLLQDNALVKNGAGDSLYPVTATFSDASVQEFVASDTISVNGATLTLDANKKAYLYLAEGTSQITFGSVGGVASIMSITPIGAGSNPEILVKVIPDSIFVSVETGLETAALAGYWSPGFTGQRGFSYWVKGETAETEIPLESGQTTYTIIGLTPGREYECRAWGTNVNGEKHDSDVVAFKTKQLFTMEVTGGSVTKGTLSSGNSYYSDTETTVTADDVPGTFLGWFENDDLVSENTSYTFILESNRKLEARFHPYSDLLMLNQGEGLHATAGFASSGNLPWQVVVPEEPELPYLQSGGIKDSQSSALSLTVSSETRQCLIFDWKVSSEKECDELSLYLGDVQKAVISGDAEWETKILELPAGEHTVKWSYTKDSTRKELDDRGYLKNLRLGSGTRTLTVAGGAVTQGTEESEGKYLYGTEITVTADDSAGAFDGWFENGELVSADAAYTFILEKDRSLEAKVHPYIDFLTIDPEEGDNLSTSFVSSGDLHWQVVEPDAPELPYLRSGGIGGSKSSALTLTVTSDIPKCLVFDWKVLSEERYDPFTYTLNGTEQARISGDLPWETVRLFLPAGRNTIKWEYSKDSSGSPDGDGGFLKNLRLETAKRILTVTGGDVTQGTAVADNVYLYGDEITVTADDRFGAFGGWFENGELVSADVAYTFTLEKDRSLEAKIYPYADFFTIDREESDNLTAGFESSGDLHWQVVEPDAPELAYLRSGGIEDSQSSALTLTVTSDIPKCLVFDWKVLSDTYDPFTYSLNGREQARISGEDVPWETVRLFLPAGTTTIKWEYRKDYYWSPTGDGGFLKNLRLESAKKTLTVTGGSVTQGTALSDHVYLFGTEITVTANPPGVDQLFGGWYDEKGLLVSTEAVYTFLIKESLNLTARFITYADFLTGADGEGVDSAVFESGGAQPWKSASDGSLGSLCLRSGSIQDSETSSLTLKLNLSRAQRLTFNWRVSSERGYDTLKFLLDGKKMGEISGDQSWLADQRHMTALIPRGEHTITWRYEKDGKGFSYDDCGYLKDLLLAPADEIKVSARPDDPKHGSVTPESGWYPVGGGADFTAIPNEGYYLQYWQDSKGNKMTEWPTLYVPAIEETYTAVFGVLNQDYSPLIAPGSEPLTIETWGSIWMMQPDGSAKSGPLGEHEESALRTVVTVPPGGRKSLLFDWMVSSPASERILFLYVDEEDYTSISGTGGGWQNSGIVLQEGTHVVEWVYRDNPYSRMAEAEEAAGLAAERPEECGWVKNIQLKTPGLYRVTPAGNTRLGKIEINWSSEGPAGDGRYYEGTQVAFIASPKAGYYCKGWKDSAGNMVSTSSYFEFTVTGDAEYTAVFALTASDYLDIVNEENWADFDFDSSWGDAWTVDADAGEARSGDMNYGGSSLRAVVRVTEPSLLTFEWKVSCDSYSGEDKLQFILGTQNQCEIQGVYGGWARYAIVLSEGSHTLEWLFEGSGPYPDGENCGWVRNVSLSKPGKGRVTVGTAENGSGFSNWPEGTETLPDGAPVQLMADPDPGYACVGWKDESGETVSEWPNFTAYVYGDKTYTPVFEEESAVYDAVSGRAVITSGLPYASPAVVLAAYDSRGILTSHTVLDLNWISDGRNKIPAPVEFQPKAGETVKVLVWDDFNSMKPLLGNPEP